jgi:RNA:NAD 2'-phosphotransferase (TPT1/KptA family)
LIFKAGIHAAFSVNWKLDMEASNCRQSASEKMADAVVNASVHHRSSVSLLIKAATAAASSGLKIKMLKMGTDVLISA